MHSSRAHFDEALTVHSIGGALKAWRQQAGLSQKDAAAHFGVPSRTYQDYERDLKSPGAGSIEAFVRAGINANWLLTGEGPMLLAELAAPAKPAASSRINIDALAAIIEGALRVAKNAPPSAIAAHSARVYGQCIEDGLITADGIGEGNLDAAA